MSAELPHELSDGLVVGARAATGKRAAIDFVHDAHNWDALILRADFPHLPQSHAYGEAKRATGWAVRRAVFSFADRPLAIATVLERRVLGARVIARVNRGPVFLDAEPTPDQQRLVYASLRRHWRGPLLIAPALPFGEPSDAVLRAAGFVRRQLHGWRSARIDLRRSEEAIWAGFTSSFRNRARNAEKAGAVLRIAEDAAAYDWLIERHVENMQEKNFRGPTPALIRALRNAAPAAVTVFQLMRGKEPLAGMSVVRFGQYAEYHVGWFGPEGRKLDAGNFLMWNIVRELRHRGVASFDVGGMRPGDGYARFKSTMNPVEFELDGEWMSF